MHTYIQIHIRKFIVITYTNDVTYTLSASDKTKEMKSNFAKHRSATIKNNVD